MSRAAFLLACFFITSCGFENTEQAPTQQVLHWSGNITEKSPRFILSYNPSLFSGPQIDRVEQWWTDVQQCTGISTDLSGNPLIIEYLPRDQMPDGSTGLFDLSQGFMVVIESDLREDRAVPGQITKHELIHYIVKISGGSLQDNTNHVSDWFLDCSGLPS